MDVQRVRQVLELHNIPVEELAENVDENVSDVKEWLEGKEVFDENTQKEIFNVVRKWDLEERKEIQKGVRDMGFTQESVFKKAKVKEGMFRMWVIGKRELPFEKEKRVFEVYDKLKEFYETV